MNSNCIYVVSLNKLSVCVYLCLHMCEEDRLVQIGVSYMYYLFSSTYPGTAVGAHPLLYFVLPHSTSSHH